MHSCKKSIDTFDIYCTYFILCVFIYGNSNQMLNVYFCNVLSRIYSSRTDFALVVVALFILFYIMSINLRWIWYNLAHVWVHTVFIPVHSDFILCLIYITQNEQRHLCWMNKNVYLTWRNENVQTQAPLDSWAVQPLYGWMGESESSQVHTHGQCYLCCNFAFPTLSTMVETPSSDKLCFFFKYFLFLSWNACCSFLKWNSVG